MDGLTRSSAYLYCYLNPAPVFGVFACSKMQDGNGMAVSTAEVASLLQSGTSYKEPTLVRVLAHTHTSRRGLVGLTRLTAGLLPQAAAVDGSTLLPASGVLAIGL